MISTLKRIAAVLLGGAWLATSAAPAQALSPEDQASLRSQCIRPLVWGGFETRDDIFEAAHTHLGEPKLKPAEIKWIKAEIERQWSEKKKAEATWPATTDFDRLDAVFMALDTSGILALHNAGNTQSDAHGDAGQLWHDRGGRTSGLRGYVYYHGQDLERVVSDGQLYIGFGIFEGSNAAPIEIARQAGTALTKAGFTVKIPANADERILMTGIDWKKRSPQ
jgi:hypothetical protein